MVPVLFTFDIQGVLKNLKNSGAKRLSIPFILYIKLIAVHSVVLIYL
jgi:hypothetical protein